MSLKGKVTLVGQTDTGRVREHNEDTIATDPDVGLLVLADGMGGYNAGEVASGIAVKTITNLVREGLAREDLGSVDRTTGLSRPSIVLRDAITRAAKEAAEWSRKEVSSNDDRLLKEMESKGAKIGRPELTPFRAAVAPTYARAKEKYGADVDTMLAEAEAIRKALPR
jgi:serine/threonine protein phosphatase PrpC